MAGTDMRGFSYLLEPVRRRREWKLEAALAHLARLNRQLREKRAASESLHEECAGQAFHASRTWVARTDPQAQSRILGYLQTLHVRKLRMQREIAALDSELRLAREKCTACQQALEVMDAHRAETLELYGIEQARRSAAQADADWIARNSQRANEEDRR